MKAILQTEFAYVWSTLLAALGAFVIVYAFLCWSLQTPAMVSMLCAMEPLLIMFTFMNADMANGWGRYRAALPFSRRDIVVGRYAAILLFAAATIAAAFVLGMAGNVIGPAAIAEFEPMPAFELAATCICSTAVVLVLVACMQSFLVKFGNAKGVRYATLAFLLVIGLGIAALSQVLDAPMMYEVADWIEANAGLMVVGIAAIGALALAASCAISLRIYSRKDL